MSEAIAFVDFDCISAAGADLASSWERLAGNGSGVKALDRYDPAQQTLQGLPAICYAGQVPLTLEELAGSPEKLKKWTEPAYHAVKRIAARVLGRLGFDSSQHDPQRVALLGGTALASQVSRDLLARTLTPDAKFILNQCHNIPLAVAASDSGLRGPCFSIGSACSSSGHALLLASQFIRGGVVDCALVVGHEFPVVPPCVAGLDWVNALYRRDDPEDRGYCDPAAASRPFSKDRRGFVLSEGVGAAFLSDAGYARRHGWPLKGYLRGGCANADAQHLTRISVENVARCMRGALETAGCGLDEVECINAHATSTPVGDAAEAGALHAVFGPRLARIPVVANKSQIGHALGAASILAASLALQGMGAGVVLPTLNHVPDPALPELLFLPRATEWRHRLTLLNSFGFGGTNVSLVVERGPDA